MHVHSAVVSDTGLSLRIFTIKQLPKNNVSSIGGGNSYLFSWVARPSVLPYTLIVYDFLLISSTFHVVANSKPCPFLNPAFLYSSSSFQVFNTLSLMVPFFSTTSKRTEDITYYVYSSYIYIGLQILFVVSV